MKKYIIYFLITTTSLLSSNATDTITTSQIVSDNDNDNDDGTVVSSGGTYELGFFSPEKSNNRYLGIWFKKIKPRTVVWVANRDNPLTDRSGVLRVGGLGHLSLVNATNATIWCTNASSGAQNPVAQLLESGNLVVRDDNNLMWQSFDHPTDTFLAGMKLGKNLVTGHEVCLTSWKNSGDPAAGNFTFAFDPTGYPQIVMRQGYNVTYRLGPWNGVGFSGLPNLQRNNIFTIGAIINERERHTITTRSTMTQ